MNNKLIIEAGNSAWNKAFNSGNVSELAKLYAENAILSPGNGTTIIGRAAIESLFRSFVEGGVRNHTLEIIEVGGNDKMIYQVARWGAQGSDNTSFGGITTSVYELGTDDKWLTRTHIWNANQ